MNIIKAGLVSPEIDVKKYYETYDHSRRVAALASRLALQADIDFPVDDVFEAGRLHDIGKVFIPEEIINKPSKLTNEEYEIIKTHTTAGYKMLTRLGYPAVITEAARNHHERFDGTGYPDGLKGYEIPLIARIVGIADAMDAMMQTRIYHEADPVEHVALELAKGAGTQFDPELIEVAVAILRDYKIQYKDRNLIILA